MKEKVWKALHDAKLGVEYTTCCNDCLRAPFCQRSYCQF